MLSGETGNSVIGGFIKVNPSWNRYPYLYHNPNSGHRARKHQSFFHLALQYPECSSWEYPSNGLLLVPPRITKG